MGGDALVRHIFRALCGNAGPIMLERRVRGADNAVIRSSFKVSQSRFMVERDDEGDSGSWFTNLAYALQSLLADLKIPLTLSNTGEGRCRYHVTPPLPFPRRCASGDP